jgi:serine/threonine protein kinase
VDTLKRFSGNNQHQHLINLLLTYHYRDQYHLLFDWADGNLLDYWKKQYPLSGDPARDCKFARWVCEQWLGVVEGLQAIHKYTSHPSLPSRETKDPSNPRVHGRHGDLKPENILWFKRPRSRQDTTDNLGSFVISDFGLTMFHHNKTKSQVNPSNLARSPTYRPPEYDVRKIVSQKCDIWSLGCVMLEFLIWYLLGWKGVEDFQTDRIKEDNCEIPEDVFFNSVEKDPLNKRVQKKESVAKASSA